MALLPNGGLAQFLRIWRTKLDYREIVERRRTLKIETFKSLADLGFDGPWITPYQITSNSLKGPVLVALHWLDESSILDERTALQHLGFCRVFGSMSSLMLLLRRVHLSRSDIYVTQTFHLVPKSLQSSLHLRQQDAPSTR